MTFYRAINHVEDIFSIILLIIFLFFGILFAFYGFWTINVINFTRILQEFLLYFTVYKFTVL